MFLLVNVCRVIRERKEKIDRRREREREFVLEMQCQLKKAMAIKASVESKRTTPNSSRGKVGKEIDKRINYFDWNRIPQAEN